MKNILLIDCCIRGKESRTKQLLDAFYEALPEKSSVTILNLMDENLRYFTGEYLEERQKLLENGEYDHPRFKYAHQFADADIVVIAAPFWDLSFPALLKVYIEQISVDGITIHAENNSLAGICRGTDLVFLTTRGGAYGTNSGAEDSDIGNLYMRALADFFGFERYHLIAADGLDLEGTDIEQKLKEASENASELAKNVELSH